MSKSANPLITVITVVYNDKIGIKKTLESVSAQTYEHLRHVVIDGGSTDGTVSEIEGHSQALWYWHSKPDKGLYDAMNQGIKLAGDGFCYFLNAGDVFDNAETISLCAKQMTDSNAYYFGDCVIHSNSDEWITPGSMARISLILQRQAYPHHQSSFYPTWFLRENLFDTRYRFIADIVLNTKAIRRMRTRYLSVRIAHSDLGGFSTGPQSWTQIRRYVGDEKLFAYEEGRFGLVARFKIESKYFLKYLMSNLAGGRALHMLMKLKNRIQNG